MNHLFKSLILLTTLFSSAYSIRSFPLQLFNEAPKYINSNQCQQTSSSNSICECDPSLLHIAMTLDFRYLRGSIASVNSILKHSSCPENTRFHFIASGSDTLGLNKVMKSTFPDVNFEIYPFDDEGRVKEMISSSIRPALDEPLNYARIYLAEILDSCISRVIYVDSDTITVDDVQKLWSITLHGSKVIAAPEYCHVKFKNYFNDVFWSDSELSSVFEGKKPCYFNTGVMVVDLDRWREGDYTNEIEKWMKVQKEKRIYELGSMPPFLLVYGGEIEGIDHRWNQHGLGGDNVVNSCRSLHPGAVSLLHWSGKGKPWVRLDENRACPVDYLWAPYDLYRKHNEF